MLDGLAALPQSATGLPSQKPWSLLTRECKRTFIMPFERMPTAFGPRGIDAKIGHPGDHTLPHTHSLAQVQRETSATRMQRPTLVTCVLFASNRVSSLRWPGDLNMAARLGGQMTCSHVSMGAGSSCRAAVECAGWSRPLQGSFAPPVCRSA